MVDQGLLDYNEPVATYWPEFAQNGKESILVKDVLRHDAKMPAFSQRINLQWTLTENIKKNMIGKIIEDEKPRDLPHGLVRFYHAQTRDYISNEIFRRVEPQGRTMAEYFEQELLEKLKMQIFIRKREDLGYKVQPVEFDSYWQAFKDTLNKDSFSMVYLWDAMKMNTTNNDRVTGERNKLISKEQLKLDSDPMYDTDKYKDKNQEDIKQLERMVNDPDGGFQNGEGPSFSVCASA